MCFMYVLESADFYLLILGRGECFMFLFYAMWGEALELLGLKVVEGEEQRCGLVGRGVGWRG